LPAFTSSTMWARNSTGYGVRCLPISTPPDQKHRCPFLRVNLSHREFASQHIGFWMAAALVVTALLFAVSVATEKRRDELLDALSAHRQRLTWWLLGKAATAVCFLSGALAGFGGSGWLAGLLMLVVYGGVIVAVHGLVVSTQTPARLRS
ncbi:hypothetical protein V4C53_47420, partial [Paraburkholderia azotifigens]|uniref:hypothetical protein n=1 Tax=Paraburkholderia azotifigens TaxID=2057004 RepID=UPI00317943AF